MDRRDEKWIKKKTVVIKSEEKRPLERSNHRWEDNRKMENCEVHSCSYGQEPTAGSCERG
jgi:hypothetical protein